MTSVISAFRWLDVLETEFDKAFVDIDLQLNDYDPDHFELIETCRERMQEMSTAWAQLVHKSQTIFQVNCKLEVNKHFLNHSKATILIFLKFKGSNCRFKIRYSHS
jgi:hypothetical protein